MVNSCGSFAARNVLGEADEDYTKYYNYFSNHRRFALPSSIGRIIGKPLLISLANSWRCAQERRRKCEMGGG
jgi:gamma-glutamylputrescine oxidase